MPESLGERMDPPRLDLWNELVCRGDGHPLQQNQPEQPTADKGQSLGALSDAARPARSKTSQYTLKQVRLGEGDETV
jgi:hypothetical protein